MSEGHLSRMSSVTSTYKRHRNRSKKSETNETSYVHEQPDLSNQVISRDSDIEMDEQEGPCNIELLVSHAQDRQVDDVFNRRTSFENNELKIEDQNYQVEEDPGEMSYNLLLPCQ